MTAFCQRSWSGIAVRWPLCLPVQPRFDSSVANIKEPPHSLGCVAPATVLPRATQSTRRSVGWSLALAK